jgi:hypothetical protein
VVAVARRQSRDYTGFVTCTPSVSYGFIRCDDKRAFDSDVFFHTSSVVASPQAATDNNDDEDNDDDNSAAAAAPPLTAVRPGDRVTFSVERPRWNSRVLAVRERHALRRSLKSSCRFGVEWCDVVILRLCH